MRLLLSLFLAAMITQGSGSTRVMVQDFEKHSLQPTVWVVNIPNENASVKLSTENPHSGKQCLALQYKFVGTGQFQYLGVPNKVNILSPVHQLRFWMRGDNSKCSYGVQVGDAGGETHQYSKNTGQAGLIDFTGWKEIVIDLDSGHETWGGDKNGKIDYPITSITFTVGQPMDGAKQRGIDSRLAFDDLSVDSEKNALETLGFHIAVVSPAYCSEVKGNTRVAVAAPGLQSVTVKCWKQGEGFGADSTVANVKLDEKGNGSFLFPANEYPHGPITLRIMGASGSVKDNCYLQLYNRGGVSWKEGLPAADPPAAKGLELVFADDFNGPLSISSTDPKAHYYDHKPPNGYQDFSVHRFSGRDSPQNPFAHVDSYLRIRASDKMQSSGLISSMKNDGSGFKVRVPCYFECRFIGPNAIGTWPGFWLMTDYMTDYKLKGDKTPCDELDIIEAYGGEGPRSPNAFDTYMITPHCWNQGERGKAIEKIAFEGMHNPIRMHKAGIPSTWYEAFHVYGCKVTETETIYYCDDIEVGRHATLPVCREKPIFFMVNLATGGGWPVDLSRYDGVADMYVDYVRVYDDDPRPR